MMGAPLTWMPALTVSSLSSAGAASVANGVTGVRMASSTGTVGEGVGVVVGVGVTDGVAVELGVGVGE